MSPISNPTESSSKLLLKRASYVAEHQPHLGYVRHLLETATLPRSVVSWPNQTTMAAMLADSRGMSPSDQILNAVVLGRVLHRVLPGLLTWHGGRHVEWGAGGVPVICETTIYRFPIVQRCRDAFAAFVAVPLLWSNDYDQWQQVTRDDGERWASAPDTSARVRPRAVTRCADTQSGHTGL
jgi:hypothetical protein